MEKTIIPVVYATDENYLFYTCVSITSLAENSRADTAYKVYVLVAGTFEDRDGLLEKLQGCYANVEIVLVKVNDELFLHTHINNAHISKAAFYRLNVCQYVDADKCIYLDSDTVVTEDLTELFSCDMGEYYLAGCRDVWVDTLTEEESEERRKKTGIQDFREYLNSGVLVFNLEKMRRDGIDKKLVEHAGYDYPYEDQDILNVCCYGHILQLPAKWNNFTAAAGRDVELRAAGVPESVVAAFQKEEGIYHYITSEARPWAEGLYWRNWYWWDVAKKWEKEPAYQKAEQAVKDREAQMDWKQCVQKMGTAEEIVLWGYTVLAREIADWIVHLKKDVAICFCDSNTEKQGEAYKGFKVYAPETVLKSKKDAFFIITSYRWQKEIEDILQKHNISKEKYYVYAIRKNLSYYRMLDKKFYPQEIEEIFLKEGISVSEDQTMAEIVKHPEWKEKYCLDRWVLRKSLS